MGIIVNTNTIKGSLKQKSISKGLLGAGDGIRTHEHLRDWTLNPAPLTWLGNPRKRGSQSHAVVVFNSIRKDSRAPAQEPFRTTHLQPVVSLPRGLGWSVLDSAHHESMSFSRPLCVLCELCASAVLSP